MQTPTHDERGGLPSASGMERVYCCPGSVAAERDALLTLPEQKEQEAATSGTRIHAALEHDSAEGLEEDEAAIALRLDSMMQSAQKEWHEQFGLDPSKTQVGNEERFFVHDGLKPVTSAKLDKVFVNGQHACCMDYKTGYKDATPAFINCQLKIQAIAVEEEFSVRNVRVAILQSRFKSKLDYCDYDQASLSLARQEMVLALWKASQPGAPRSAGSWCAFCKARAICREHIGYSLVPVSNTGLTLHSKVSKQDVIAAVSRLNPAELLQIVSRASVITNTIEAAKDAAKALPAEVLKANGFQLVDGGSTRTVPDSQKMFDCLWAAGLLGSDVDKAVQDFKEFTSVKLTALEVAMIPALAKARRITQKDAKPAFKDIIAPAVVLEPKAGQLKESVSP